MMRPDERANLSEIERDKNFRKNIQKGVGAAASIGTAALGAGLSSRILPLLNEYVPTDLAMKGLSKISPKIADFLKRGQSMGLDLKEGMNYVKNQITPKEKPKDNRNIIEQYSPELHQAISQEIKKGRTPIEATNIAAFQDKKYESIIKKIISDHKVPFSSIIESIYGKGEMGQPSQDMNNQDQGQQQQGQGAQALMSILQKIQQSRGM